MLKKIWQQSLLIIFLLISLFFTPKIFAQEESILEKNESPQETLVAQKIPETETLQGTILEVIEEGKETINDQLIDYQKYKVLITKGSLKGETIELKHSAASFGLMATNFQTYQANDKIKIQLDYNFNGEALYNILGKVKIYGLINLVILFLVVVLLVGRLWGGLAIGGLVFSFLVIFKLIIPLLMKGFDPILSIIIGAILIIPVTFYISHGFNNKTHAGVISTFISLLITSLLSLYFVEKTYLTGFANEDVSFLQVETANALNIKNLLLAGMMISALGILDDITIGQAATVEQLKKANPKTKKLALFKQAMEVGQDHISSMVNTLILVYAGANLPLLLLFFNSQRSVGEIVELELVAQEIVRMLVESIGLVLAAPLATLIAVIMLQKQEAKND